MDCNLSQQPFFKTPNALSPVVAQGIGHVHAVGTHLTLGHRLPQIRELLYLVLLLKVPEYRLPFSTRSADPFWVTRITLYGSHRENFCIFLSVFHFVAFECHHVVYFISTLKYIYYFHYLKYYYVWELSFTTLEIFALPSQLPIPIKN